MYKDPAWTTYSKACSAQCAHRGASDAISQLEEPDQRNLRVVALAPSFSLIERGLKPTTSATILTTFSSLLKSLPHRFFRTSRSDELKRPITADIQRAVLADVFAAYGYCAPTRLPLYFKSQRKCTRRSICTYTRTAAATVSPAGSW